MTSSVAELLEHRAKYEKARLAIWGKPAAKNIAAKAIIAAETAKKEERRRWIEDAAKAIRNERYKTLITSGMTTTGFASHQPLDVDYLPLAYSIRVEPKKTMQRIARDVLKQHHGVTLDDIKGDSRHIPIMLARRHVIASIRMARPDISYPALGRFLCKDPTTCMHAVKMFAKNSVNRLYPQGVDWSHR